MNLGDGLSIQNARRIRAAVETNHAHVNIRARENPVAVALGEKDSANVLDPFEHFAIRAASNRLRRQQASAFALLFLNRIRRFREPVAAKVSRARHAAAVDCLQRLTVSASKFIPLAA